MTEPEDDPSDQPPPRVLNLDFGAKDMLPGGARTWVNRVERAGWDWVALYSCVWQWRRKKDEEPRWRLYHSFILGARPGPGPWHISGCWESEVIDLDPSATRPWINAKGKQVEQAIHDYKARYQMLNHYIYGLHPRKGAAARVTAVLNGEEGAPCPNSRIKSGPPRTSSAEPSKSMPPPATSRGSSESPDS